MGELTTDIRTDLEVVAGSRSCSFVSTVTEIDPCPALRSPS